MANDLKTQMEQVVRRIADAGVIAVVLPAAPGMDVIGSAEALTSGLRAIGKTVSVFGPPAPAVPPGHALVPWGTRGADDEPLREFILSFDLTRSPIKELKYERADNRINIILSPTGRIRREDVEFRWGELRYDIAITIGAPSLDAVSTSIGKVPELIHEKPVLNIDVSAQNQGYGELNLLPPPAPEAERPTLAELTDTLLAALNVPADDPPRATALLAALASATGGFNVGRTGAGAFALAAALRRRGADPALIAAYASRPDLGVAKLAGRALARSRLVPESDLLLSVLTKEDFANTATTPDAIPDVLERIGALLPRAGTYALLWQHPADGTVYARTVPPTEHAAGTLNAEGSFLSFAAAEEHIRRLLSHPDAVE